MDGWMDGQSKSWSSTSAANAVEAPTGGAVSASAPRPRLCLPGLVDVAEGLDLRAMSCREAFDREL